MPQQTSMAAELIGDASTPLSNILPVLGAMRMINHRLRPKSCGRLAILPAQ